MEIIVYTVIIFAIVAAIISRLIDENKKSQERHRIFSLAQKHIWKKTE